MSDEDQEAQRQRAERLREQSERLKQGNPEKEGTPEKRPDESPNEYVNRRMREIARKKRERS